MTDKPPKIMVSSRSKRLEDEELLQEDEREVEAEEESFFSEAPPPDLSMPGQSTLAVEEKASFDERLFDLSGTLWALDRERACQRVLDFTLSVIPCAAGSIALGTINDPVLRFVAAVGPLREQVLGMELPADAGLVGLCLSQRETLSVPEGEGSSLQFAGAHPEDELLLQPALCVPILDEDEMVYGVIELLSPASRAFLDEDEELVEEIARTLAGVLARE